MMELTEWMGIASTVGLGILGWLKFRQSQKVDAVSAQSGVASTHQAGIDQVVKGLNDLIDQYQESNANFRTELEAVRERLILITAERDALKLEVARLRKKYAANGEDP